MQVQLNEQDYLLKSWSLDKFSTTPPPPIKKIKRYYVLEFNLAKALRDGARTFSEYREGETPKGKSYEQFFQFFVACAERLMSKICAGAGSQKNPVNKRTKHTKKKRSRPDQEGNPLEAEEVSEEEAEREDLDEGISFDLPLDAENFAGSNAQPGAEVYLETLTMEPSTELSINTDPAGNYGVCGYRLWVFVRADVTMETQKVEILEENVALAAKAGDRQGFKGGARAQQHVVLGPYERFRNVKSRSDLMVLADMYSNGSYYSDNVNSAYVSADIFDSEASVISMKTMFSFYTAALQSDPRIRETQSIFAKDSYFRLEEEDATTTICFPYPEFVQRLYPDQLKVDVFFAKYLPHYQRMCIHPLTVIYPRFFSPILFASSKMAPHSRRIDTIVKNLTGMASSGDMVMEEGATPSCDLDMEEKRRRAAASIAAIEDEFPNYSATTALVPFEQCRLSLRQRATELLELAKSSTLQYYFKSEFSVLEEESNRVLGEITRIYKEALCEAERAASEVDEEWNALQDVPSNPKATTPYHSINKKAVVMRKATLRARRMYAVHQKYMFDQYSRRCRAHDSNISQVGKAIHSFRNECDLYNHDVKHYKIDRSMTTFANLMVRLMEEYDSVYYISVNHRHMLTIEMASLDAFRHAFKLHWNVFTHSNEGGQGKTFMWEILEEIRIKGTYHTLTYQTVRADCVEGDNNDVIKIFNEMPAAMFIGGGKNGDDQIAGIKEQMTSQRCRVYYFDKKTYDDTGVRSSRYSDSECIGVWMGSTNHDMGKVPKAMRSRLHVLNCEAKGQPRRTTQDLMYAEGINLHSDTQLRQKTTMEKKLMQAIVYEVEKLIQVKALTPVTMDACMTVFVMVSNFLEDEGHTTPGRNFERDIVMAAILAKVDAIDRLFFLPGSAYFGKPVTVEALRLLDTMLVGFVHHAAFVMGLTIDQIIEPLEEEVLAAIRGLHMQDKYRNCFKPQTSSRSYISVDDPASDNGEPARHVRNENHRPGGFSSAYVRKDHIYGSYDRDVGFMSRQAVERDSNYICFPDISASANVGELFEFCITVSAFMESGCLGTKMRPTPNAVFEVVNEWRRRTFECRGYKKIDPPGDGLRFNSGWPVVEEDPSTDPSHKAICLVDKNSVSFLYAFVFRPAEKGKDKLHRAMGHVLNRRHQYRKKLVIGLTEDATPNVLHTVEMGHENYLDPALPDMVVPNPSFMDEVQRVLLYGHKDDATIDPIRKREYTIIDMDIDAWAVQRRSESLFLSPYRLDPSLINEGSSTVVPKARPPLRHSSEESDEDGEEEGDEDGVAWRGKRYFVGLDIRSIHQSMEAPAEPTPSENLKDLESVQLEPFDGILEDYDMGPKETYMVETNGVLKPHWEVLADAGVDIKPYIYKMIREHWRISNHKESLCEYGDRVVYNYPDDLKSCNKSRKQMWKEGEELSSNPDLRFKTLTEHPEYFVMGLAADAMVDPHNQYAHSQMLALSKVPSPPSNRTLQSHAKHDEISTQDDGESDLDGDGNESCAGLDYRNKASYRRELKKQREIRTREMMEAAYGTYLLAKKKLSSVKKKSKAAPETRHPLTPELLADLDQNDTPPTPPKFKVPPINKDFDQSVHRQKTKKRRDDDHTANLASSYESEEQDYTDFLDSSQTESFGNDDSKSNKTSKKSGDKKHVSVKPAKKKFKTSNKKMNIF